MESRLNAPLFHESPPRRTSYSSVFSAGSGDNSIAFDSFAAARSAAAARPGAAQAPPVSTPAYFVTNRRVSNFSIADSAQSEEVADLFSSMNNGISMASNNNSNNGIPFVGRSGPPALPQHSGGSRAGTPASLVPPAAAAAATSMSSSDRLKDTASAKQQQQRHHNHHSHHSHSHHHHQQQQQQQQRVLQKFDMSVYFRELNEIVPALTEEVIAKEQQQLRAARSSGSMISGAPAATSGVALSSVTLTPPSAPLTPNDHRIIRELLYHHACVVEALSAQLPVDVEISSAVLRSTAENCAEAARLRVDFLNRNSQTKLSAVASSPKSALIAMRVLTYLAIQGGNGWRERQRATELRDLESTIEKLRAQVSNMQTQLGDAHKEIGALQTVVNETRMQSHRQLMDSEMKRRELQEELTKQQKAALHQQKYLEQKQHQLQQLQLSANRGGGDRGVGPHFGQLEASMTDEAVLQEDGQRSNNNQVDTSAQLDGSYSNDAPPGRVALLRGMRDAWDGGFAAHHNNREEQTQLRKRQEAIKANKYGVRETAEGQQHQQHQQQQHSLQPSPSRGVAGRGAPSPSAAATTVSQTPAGRWLADQQKEERSAEIRRKVTNNTNNNNSNISSSPSSSPPPFSASAPLLSDTLRRRSAVTFTSTGDGGSSHPLTATRSSSPQQKHNSNTSNSRNAAFLAGVKDMLNTLVPERQRYGIAEEDALAELEEAEIVHGHVSDITGEPPSSDLKVVRTFTRHHGGGSAQHHHHMLRKRQLFGAGHADAIPEILTDRRPPQIPDHAFIEEVFRALQTLQVGSFNSADELELDQVIEYLNTHWPQLDDLLGCVGGPASSLTKPAQLSASGKSAAVREFVSQHLPLHRKNFATLLLMVARL